MLKMTLKKFFETDIDEGNRELYILKKDKRILYIGISERGIWNRWFGAMSGHMPRNGWGEFFPGSQAGRAVIENFPKSWEWQIELWAIKDCCKFLAIPYNERFTIKHVEPLMVEKLRPELNRMHANYGSIESDLIDTSHLKDVHRKTFG
jgi:hypothetical protein